jgi:hypothetical protein
MLYRLDLFNSLGLGAGGGEDGLTFCSLSAPDLIFPLVLPSLKTRFSVIIYSIQIIISWALELEEVSLV